MQSPPRILHQYLVGKMIGILLASHGRFAEGMLDSSHLFFGEDIPALEALCLMPEDSPDEYAEKLKEKVLKLNDGDGVIVLCDLLFGTPCNMCASLMSDDVKVLCGANMSLLLELLGKRNAQAEDRKYPSVKEIDIKELVKTGSDGVCDLEEKIGE